MSVRYERCVLSEVCDGPITRPEESYRVWCICDREASTVVEALAHEVLSRHGKRKKAKIS